MPSIEDKCVVPETLPPTKKDFLAADVEELVAAIKHNLQLKAKPCHGACTKHRRVSPYSTAGGRYCRQKMCDSVEHSIHHSQFCVLSKSKPAAATDSSVSEDPYEMLQELLREGSLIKEAVKRIQLDLENKRPKKPPADFYELDYENNEEVEVV